MLNVVEQELKNTVVAAYEEISKLKWLIEYNYSI